MADRLHLTRWPATTIFLLLAAPAAAHPAPFSFVDVRLGDGIAITAVLHLFDVAHDLGIDPAENLLDPSAIASRRDQLGALVTSRLSLDSSGRRLVCRASAAPELLAERQSIVVRLDCPAAGSAAALRVSAAMFPYDPIHQTFLNIYEGGRLTTQTILDRNHQTFEYFSGTPQGVLGVVRRFIGAGIHHILIGPDHLLFLVGLLLLGGTVRRLALVVTAFTAAHSLTLSLAALGFFAPSPRVIEPAIALSIVYVGADNLLVRGGRDFRVWIAFGFGFIHGFGFANVLREMDLPRRALGWSLFSFNTGVEIGQLAVVIVVGAALAALRGRSETAGLRVVRFGSIGVIAAGAFWFVQRVFFPGGLS